MRLGRLPADPHAIARAPVMHGHYAAMPPPQKLDRRDIEFQPREFGNLRLPDCSAAGLANAMLAVSALDGLVPQISDPLVPRFYAECVDCDPTEAAMAATSGAVLLDVLRRQATLGMDVGQQTRLAALYGSVAPSRMALVRCMAGLGVAYIGVQLFDRDMQGGTWDDDGSDRGAEVGGHCVCLWDYLGLGDTDTARLLTWGGFQAVKWRWLDRRVDEAWGLFWRQLTPARMTPEDEDVLAARVMEFG